VSLFDVDSVAKKAIISLGQRRRAEKKKERFEV
jgi:hypothetical protein